MSIKVRTANNGKSAIDNFVPDTMADAPVKAKAGVADAVPDSVKPKSKPISTEDIKADLRKADEDFGDMGFGAVLSQASKKAKKNLPVTVANDAADLGNEDIGSAEAEFRSSELDSHITPVVQEKVKEAVHQTVALNNDRMKLSMTEVLDEYSNDRMEELKKDRKKRQNKRRFWSVVKFIAVFVIIAVLMTNAQIRTRVYIIFQDTKKLVVDIFNDDATTSNNVAEDFLDNLGTHLNDVNTYEVEETNEE